jgi:2,3-dihydroxyphenylpropionate 1,2-dioxygenase
MSEIVAGIGMSHNTLINIGLDWTKDQANVEKWRAALAEARTIVEEARPDVAVVIGSNHFMGVYADLMPSFTLGVGEAQGVGDEGTPPGPFPVDTALARKLAFGLVEREFDIAFSLRLTVDHGITMAHQHLLPGLDIPVVPMIVNVFTRPLATLARCRALGEAFREIIGSDGENKRVLVIGTGGLSHYLPFFPKWYDLKEGEERLVEFMFPRDEQQEEDYVRTRGEILSRTTPRVNPDFDQEFVKLLSDRDWDAILAMSDDEVERRAGNGAAEIRNWILVAAAAAGTGRQIAYIPMHEWHAGLAVAHFQP